MKFGRRPTIANPISQTAFTLIELLVVVSIISILSLIALPNLTLALTRAKVARVRNDMRVVANGLEMYAVDYNSYPRTFGLNNRAITFNDPVKDIFDKDNGSFYYENPPTAGWGLTRIDEELQTTFTEELGVRWILASIGPDRDLYNGSPLRTEGDASEPGGLQAYINITAPYRDYDATNGTISYGNIFRTSKDAEHLHGNERLLKDLYVLYSTERVTGD